MTMPDSWATVTDFELIEAESYAVSRLAEHLEMDCEGGGEFDCPSCDRDRAVLAAARAEMDRRDAAGVSIPDGRVGLQALGSFGYEWQLEQAERAGVR